MADPYKNLSAMQTAWMQAWANSAQQMFQCWQHVFNMQQGFLKHADIHHREHVEIASGASLTDKYGKRSHDIDPERDV
ncbi:MAG: hypothetical protein H7Z12_08745 [Rhodospirillaceae bacterium]|nr:hypothetical protein [Rhodospirillales bacterium]